MPAASPVGFTDTLSVPGVVPLAGAAVSHDPPLAVVLVAVKLSAVPLLVTDTLCAGGAAAPAWAVNDKVVGLSTRLGRAATAGVSVEFAL